MDVYFIRVCIDQFWSIVYSRQRLFSKYLPLKSRTYLSGFDAKYIGREIYLTSVYGIFPFLSIDQKLF